MAAPFVTSLTLDVPAGTTEGNLMIAAIAQTWTDGPIDPNVAVITPPNGWTEILADYPGGTLNFGNWGDGNEEIRLGVYYKVAEAVEPASYTWDWTAATSCPAAGYIGSWAGDGASLVPSVNVAATAVRTIAVGGANPIDVESPDLTTTVPNTILLAFFVARNGLFPAPGGTAFTVPVGMTDLTPAVNLQTSGGGTQPLGLAVFKETIAAIGATGTRTSSCDVDSAPPNPFQGMGYAICLQGCDGVIIPTPGPGPGPG